MEKTKLKIKPCPFCNENRIVEDPIVYEGLEIWTTCQDMIYVACRTCEAAGPMEATESLAIKKWNQRPVIKTK